LITIQLDEYNGGNPPYLDMDLVVAGSTYYYDNGAYTQLVPANISSPITLKTKDGLASHLWGSFTTASATLKVFEDGILIVDQTNFYRKNEGAVDFTSNVTFQSGKSYVVSGSNWTFVGATPATTTTTSTTSNSTSTTTSTTTAAPTTTSTTTVAGTTTSTTTTCGPLPPYSYTMYYDYDDSLPRVIGFTNANDACTATNSFTVYSYDSPLVVGSELYFDTGCGPDVISGDSYALTQNHYRIGNDVIRLTDDGDGFYYYIIYDFVQTCGTTTSTTTSTSTTTTTTAAPCSSTDYLLFNETGSPLSWTGLDCNDNSIGNTINSGQQAYTGCVKDGTLSEGSLTIVSSVAC